MRKPLLIWTALITLAVSLAPGAASAASASQADPKYDASRAEGDITSLLTEYQDGEIALGVQVLEPSDPEADPNWILYDTGIIWDLDTNGDGQEEYSVLLLNDGVDMAASVLAGSNPVPCAVGWTQQGTQIWVGFDANCIGHPGSYRARAYFAYDFDLGTSEDFVPDDESFCCLTPETLSPPPPTGGDGYWMMDASGKIYNFGKAGHSGNAQPSVYDGADPVDLEPAPPGMAELYHLGPQGYLILYSNGRVQSLGGMIDHFGTAHELLAPGEMAVSLSFTPEGRGYWVFTDRGNAFPFGNAKHYGDMGDVRLNGPILDSVATPTGRGYWMVGSDGGIFSFGDAKFYGSMGGRRLNRPVMSMAADPDGVGYWLVASDGGIFAFEAPFRGSAGNLNLNKPISGMVPGAGGYLMVAEDGGIFAYGDVAFHGSLGKQPPAAPVVAVALLPI